MGAGRRQEPQRKSTRMPTQVLAQRNLPFSEPRNSLNLSYKCNLRMVFRATGESKSLPCCPQLSGS